MNKPQTAISPTRAEDYPAWYQEVVKAAELAENSVVRGCMVIKPWGYAIWENIQAELDRMIKETGHENLYFPLFVPLSFLEKEATHVDGFAKECAVVTHHRLEANEEGKLIPAGELEEPLVVRPTSETIIGEAYARWINSYRDLPLLYNQWANVVRWEMRTRMFLRTTEFLWQEGHTAHATAQEAMEETEKMLEVYRILNEDFLAVPLLLGAKTEGEKFPGADITYTIEAMMQDKKALQSGTSHFLGQNFAKAFNIKYLSAEGREEFVWTTSWGTTTRLIGGMIMTHSDDDGLVLPPKIAPLHVVIVPVTHKSENPQAILDYCEKLKSDLQTKIFNNKPVKVKVDTHDKRPGDKMWGWIKKGVPVRLEIGPQELEKNSVFMGRRDLTPKDKQAVQASEFVDGISDLLEEIQRNIFQKAVKFRDENSYRVNSAEEFYDCFKEGSDKDGFVWAYWIGDPETEEKLKAEFKVTPRCLPLSERGKLGKCIFTGQEGAPMTVFARSY